MSGSATMGDKKKTAETFVELCSHLENNFGLQIPEYIKNLLLLGGFDNRVVLASLRESDIANLENFAQTEEYSNYCYRSTRQSSDYFGIYWASLFPYPNSKKFKIPPGHRRLLLLIATYLKQSSDSPENIN